MYCFLMFFLNDSCGQHGHMHCPRVSDTYGIIIKCNSFELLYFVTFT